MFSITHLSTPYKRLTNPSDKHKMPQIIVITFKYDYSTKLAHISKVNAKKIKAIYYFLRVPELCKGK